MKPELGNWICGRHAVEESLRGGKLKIVTVYFLNGDRKKFAEIERLARRHGARVNFVSRNELERVVGNAHHQGMAARIQEKKGAKLEDFLAGMTKEKLAGTLLVALDQIQDPHNVGAIARSAACLGAAGLLFPDRRQAPLTQTVVSTSAGAIGRIKTFMVGNLSETLKRLKDEGFWIYGADMGGSPLWSSRLNYPMVLVIGSEGKGIRPLVKEQCHEIVAVPQSAGGVESLNASCAASVLLYEAARQKAVGG